MKKNRKPAPAGSILEVAMAQAFAEAEAAGMLTKGPDPIAQGMADAMERAALSTRHLWRYRDYGIAVSADRPKLQLSEDLALPPAFRAETNTWMREFFSPFNQLADGQVIVLERNKTMIMNPRTLATVRAAAERAGEPFVCLHADGWKTHPQRGEPNTWCPHCGYELPF